MNVCVIGTGYVGLVTGACFAEFGVNVVCVDKEADKIAALEAGEIPIYEPGLEDLVERNVREQRLSFSTDTESSVRDALVVFIAVGTPAAEDGSTDLGAVEAVAREIGRAMDSYKVVVTKSTVPVGTGQRVRHAIEAELHAAGRDVHFSVASNPEFLREGAAIGDFMRPDRVVVGVEDEQAHAILRDLFRPLFLIETPFVVTNVETAELSKYAANAFLATKISFINEMANLCERVGADVHAVAKAMGLDRRIGSKFLHPGPGYGGSCFPKDTLSAAHFAREAGETLEVVEAVIRVNERQRLRMVDKVTEALGGETDGRTVGVLGLSFKPETDDMRDAPAVEIIRGLQGRGVTVRAYDPVAMPVAARMMPDVQMCKNAYEACEGADAMLLITEWNQFRMLDLERLRSVLRQPVVVDLRNVYEPGPMREAGFHYSCVGR
ncbi:MAG: UDP-glucose/GDP-mannose dehydrogenase family protein [Deltaproteobacteria bacterium]|nr:UDP-glucose/GDP-mannose dehydrogenase family protein [Deltaproteobacteria bacterium]MBW2445002.1 UDP-glucose/GDP-mannose dehydrogenase family protein [Deltaproteobacteria bacterium]